MSRGPLLVALAGLVLSRPATGQTIGDLQDELSDSLRDAQFAASFAGLIALSDELELSGARYRLDDDVDTRITALSFPFRTTFHPWGEDEPGLQIEGVVGYARASQKADDVYQGQLPGLETAIDVDWTTYGGLVGLGLAYELIEDELELTPLVNVGLARIESDADYEGPGASTTSTLFDGLAFNWEAYTASWGGALRLEWDRDLGGERELELVGRYDLRWTETFEADDPAQEFTSRLQLATLRAQVGGPTTWQLAGHDVDWRAIAGYRYFVEGSLFDVEGFGLLGGALELDAGDELPVGRKVALNGAVLLGEDVLGFTVGVGLSF